MRSRWCLEKKVWFKMRERERGNVRAPENQLCSDSVIM